MNLTKLGFTKIAEKKKKDYDVGTGFKHMVAGDLVGSAVATVGATPFIKKDILPEFLRSPLEKDKRDSKTKMENRNLSKGLIKRIKKSKINYLDTPHTASGAYNPATNTIIAPKAKPAIIAHEFGHAKSFRKSKSLAPIYLTSKFAPAAGTLAATIQDPDSTLAKATPAIVAAGSVPMIAEEHRAWHKGKKEFKKLKPSAKALKDFGGLKRRALGSYWGRGIGFAAATEVARRLKKKYINQDSKV